LEACGKAILNGEHFVIHGAPALAVPLRAARLRLRHDGSTEDPRVVAAWRAAWEMMDLPAPDHGPAPFAIDSDIPLGSGLGSSAALSVALVRWALNLRQESATAVDVAARARRIEDLFHRPSSGLDPAVVAFEQPIHWHPPAPPEALRWPFRDLDLLVAVAPGTRSTAEAVLRVREFATAHPDRFATMRQRSEALTARWVESLRDGVPPRGEWLRDAHEMLRDLGLSSPAIEALVAAMTAAGAQGAKISGAGMAGAVLALVPVRTLDRVAQAAIQAGATAVFPAGLCPSEARQGPGPQRPDAW